MVSLHFAFKFFASYLFFHLPHVLAGTVDLAGVVAGAVVAFIFVLILLATSIVMGVVLKKAKQRKGKSPAERIEGTEMIGISPTASTCKQQENIEANCEREDELHCERTDVLGQSCLSTVRAVRSVGDYYDIIDVPSQEVAGPQCNDAKEDSQHVDQVKETPSAVYAVVDKCKKQKTGKMESGANTTTTQGPYTEEQHYEGSNILGQDWFGNVAEVRPKGTLCDALKGCAPTDTKRNAPQSEPCNPNAVYAVVDKSKKKDKAMTNDAPSLTAAHAEAD